MRRTIERPRLPRLDAAGHGDRAEVVDVIRGAMLRANIARRLEQHVERPLARMERAARSSTNALALVATAVAADVLDAGAVETRR